MVLAAGTVAARALTACTASGLTRAAGPGTCGQTGRLPTARRRAGLGAWWMVRRVGRERRWPAMRLPTGTLRRNHRQQLL